MKKYAKVCKSMQKYAKVCKSQHVKLKSSLLSCPQSFFVLEDSLEDVLEVVLKVVLEVVLEVFLEVVLEFPGGKLNCP